MCPKWESNKQYILKEPTLNLVNLDTEELLCAMSKGDFFKTTDIHPYYNYKKSGLDLWNVEFITGTEGCNGKTGWTVVGNQNECYIGDKLQEA
jgi:hypothetical protein